MFKELLLLVLVSVVWSAANATYILDNNDDYGLFRDFRLDSYPSLYQTHLDEYDDDHGILLSSLPNHELQYNLQSANVFHRPQIETSGFKPILNQDAPSSSSAYNQNNQNVHNHRNENLSQQQIEIKYNQDNQRNNLPESKSQVSFQGFNLRTPHFPGFVINQSPYIHNSFQQLLKQAEAGGYNNQNSHHASLVQTKIEEDNKEQYYSNNLKQSSEIKSSDINDENSYGANEKNNPTKGYSNEKYENLNGSNYQNIQNVLKNSNLPVYHDYQPENEEYRVIYNQDPSSSALFRIHLPDNQEYSVVPVHIGGNNGVFDLGGHGIGYPSLSRNSHNTLVHGNQHLINLGEDTLYQIGHDNTGDLNENTKLNSEELSTYDTHGNNGSDYKSSNNNAKVAHTNVEQKAVEINLKSNSGQPNAYDSLVQAVMEYKDAGSVSGPNYPETKIEIPVSNLEQKPVDVGLQSDSSYKTSYNLKANDDQYKVVGTPSKSNYADNRIQMTDVQQKSVEIDLKSDSESYESPGSYQAPSEYEGIGSTDKSKYPSQSSKDSKLNIEQKSVEISLKTAPKKSNTYDGFDSSEGEYDGIGSVDAPKYPIMKQESSTKLEQKSVEVKSYQEVKSSVSSHQKDILRKSNDKIYGQINSGYQRPSLGKQGIAGDSQKYPTSGIISNSFRNIGGQNSNIYNGGTNVLRPVEKISSRPSANSGGYNSHTNSYFSSGRQIPTQNSYFEIKRPNSTGLRPYQGAKINVPDANYPKSIHSSQTYTGSGLKPSSIEISRKHPQQSSYRGGGETSVYSGNRNIPTPIPKYAEPVPWRSYVPRFPQQDIVYNYSEFAPNLSSKEQSSNEPATSINYLTRGDNKPSSLGLNYSNSKSGGINIPSVDYSSGTSATEYPGIGEISSLKSADESKPKPYTKPHSPVTEQKRYRDDSPTAPLEDSYKISHDEYSGIGEIGSAPAIKSEIVGGRRPVKRPLKSTSIKTGSYPRGVKGKTDAKPQQRYLPITETLSDSKSGTYLEQKPESKQYGNIKSISTKEPEKIEQQEELSYEGLLAGPGAQSNAVGSSGFGFNRSPAVHSGIRDLPLSSDGKDENLPPMPYEFEFEVNDDEHGSEQYRQEKMNDDGFLTGRYGYKDAEGIFRQVEYEASKDGFKVNKIRTNEPGTDNENPADVQFEVEKQR